MALKLRLVLDSNILFAAAIKEGTTARLLLSDRLDLIAPERLFVEFRKRKELLLKKTRRTPQEFEKFVEILEERIQVVPKVEFESWLPEAKEKSPANDFPFTALSKAYGVPVWSNDKKVKEFMKRTGFVEVLNTREVLEKLRLR